MKNEEMQDGAVLGAVHSVQSLGAVDGPGLRSVVFLRGCPLRCAYCHNPDTWEVSGGEKIEPGRLVERLLRFRTYWGDCCAPTAPGREGQAVTGGVTISGGEPLFQAEFVRDVFARLHEAGVHTALDTSGTCDLRLARGVLRVTDLALVDLKFLTEEEYRDHCRGSLKQTERFLELTAQMGVPVWVRHVAVPGLTASEDYMGAVRQKAEALPNLEKLEFLPYHDLGREKYRRLGIEYPLERTKVMEPGEWEELLGRVLRRD